MQQIERYGVIALVFLLVTIVAISFWGDSKSPGFWARLTGKGQPKKEEVAKVPDPVQLPPQVANPELALSPGGELQQAPPVPSVGQPPAPGPIDQRALGSATVQPPEGVALVGQPPVVTQPPLPTDQRPAPPVFVPVPKAPPASSPTPAPRSTPVTGTPRVYTVRSGDSLSRIARTELGNEARWEEIAAMNAGVNPRALAIGQKLRLPAAGADARPTTVAAAPKAAPAATSKKVSSGGRVAIVRKGDTLSAIARRELGDEQRWQEIAKLNPGIVPSRLMVGARLNLPGGELLASAAAPVQASSKPRVR